MKFKCRKIRNISKNICTCEQKIAYNYAFQYRDIGQKILKQDVSNYLKSEALFKIEHWILDSLKKNKAMEKYNHDIIMISFKQGFVNYCEKEPTILTDYKEIGKIFNIPYEII